MPNIDDYYFSDQYGHKLNPKGMALICHYYRNKHNLNNMFSAANYNEAGDLIGKLKSDYNRFGIVYINTRKQLGGTSHKGAIFVDGNKAFILDSLGVGEGSGAKDMKGYLIENNLFTKNNIYISTVKIQHDYTSCGTLSFLFLKETLRMGDTFKDFMLTNKDTKNEIDTLPPNLLKYMQSISKIQEKDKDNQDYYDVYPQIPIRKNPQQTETLMDYVKRHTKSTFSPKKNAVVDQSVATSKRAEKHINMINNLLSDSNALLNIESEMLIATEKDYSIEILGINTPTPFLFTPTKKEKKVEAEMHEQNSDCGDSINVFDFMATPPVTPPRPHSRTNSNQSTPTRSPLKDITSRTNLRRSLISAF